MDHIAVMYAGRMVEQGPVAQIVQQPRHPYTAGLLASSVGAEHRGRPLRAIPGAPPDLAALPSACSFAPRCDQASDVCRRERPPLLHQGVQSLACWQPLLPFTETP